MRSRRVPLTAQLKMLVICAILFTCAASSTVSAQTWTWRTETVDSNGKATAIRIDDAENLHVSYGTDQGLWKYAYRDANTKRWYKMTIRSWGGVNYTSMALDKDRNPYLCATYRRMTFARFAGGKWDVQEINTDGAPIGYSCAVGVSPDGKPYITWYKEQAADGTKFVHLKYATLRDGQWKIQTLDSAAQTGKWHSLLVDGNGIPHISYDAFVDGFIKYAVWTNDQWRIMTADHRIAGDPEYNVGMGNSLALDSQGLAHISYYTTHTLRYVSEQPQGGWKVQTVDNVDPSGGWVDYRSALVLDHQGFPHIAYQDGAALKHAYWDGAKWRIQLLVSPAVDFSRYGAMTLGKDDSLYLSYRDPADGSLKVATGVLNAGSQNNAGIISTSK